MKFRINEIVFKDRSNCLIEAAKGGHTEIVKLLLEYPKSVTQRTQIVAPTTAVEPLHHDLINENNQEGEEEGLTTTLPNSFPLSTGFYSDKKSILPSFYFIGDNKKSSPTIQFPKNLQKIVPENILDILPTGVNDIKGLKSNFLHLIRHIFFR